MTHVAKKRGRSNIPLRQPTGLYVHSSPPTKIPVHPSVIRQWLRGGEIARLQDMVLQGQGGHLIGEYSPNLKARAFINVLPKVLKRLDELHAAARDGRIDKLDELLRREPKLNLELSRDSSGLGLLHKAVIMNNVQLQEWLIERYPQTIHVLDKEKRTPLHYAGGSESTWNRLTQAGADFNVLDSDGNPPAFYMLHPRRLRLPAPDTNNRASSKKKSDQQGLIIKPSNIRIWIHDKDIGRLQKVIWEGMGSKLCTETSSQPVVKRFLSAVPYIMGSIREVHTAAVNNDVELLRVTAAEPVPSDILLSKDANGLSPLHKAAGLGNVEVAREIVNRVPNAVNVKDNLDRTPLHYAAGLKEPTMYQFLVDSNATDHLEDKKGNTPSHYRAKPIDLEGSRLLNAVPDAPRTAHIFPPSWDWRLLSQESQPKDPAEPPAENSSSDSVFKQTKKFEVNIPGYHKKQNDNEVRQEMSEDEGVGSEMQASVDDTLSPHSDLNEEDGKAGDSMTPSSDLPSRDDYEGNREGSGQLKRKAYNRNPPAIEESDQNTPEFCGTAAMAEAIAATAAAGGRMKTSSDDDDDDVEMLPATSEQTKMASSFDRQFSLNERRNSSDELVRSSPEHHLGVPDDSQEPMNEFFTNESGNTTNDQIPRSINSDFISAERAAHPTDSAQIDSNRNNDDDKQEGKASHEQVKEFIQAERAHRTDPVRIDSALVEQNESEKQYSTDRDQAWYDQVNDFIEAERAYQTDSPNPSDRNTIGDLGNKAGQPQHDQINDFIRAEQDHRTDSIRNHGNESLKDDQPITLNSIGGARAEVLAITPAPPDEELIDEEEKTAKDGEETKRKQKAAQNEISEADRKIAEQIIKSGDMEAMAEMVLNGQGMALMNLKSDNPDVQLFIGNIPQYIAKIDKVHKAAREGNLRGVQTALDRRKFAVSRDNSTPLRPTPLHVATLFGRTNILRYLAGRFPETMHAQDTQGRTPLHYAATLPDNGHFYSLLVTLGADKAVMDNNGKTAEDYLKKEGHTRDELLAEYQNRSVPIDMDGLNFNRYSDKGAELMKEGYPIFNTEDSQYLATTLGDPLIKGLTEVAQLKPQNPVFHLANYLLTSGQQKNQQEKPKSIKGQDSDSATNAQNESEAPQKVKSPPKKDVGNNSGTEGDAEDKTEEEEDEEEAEENEEDRFGDVEEEDEDDDKYRQEELKTPQEETSFHAPNRDEHGQSMVHFAAARSHGRNAMFQLLQEVDINVGLRDSLYRTPRDIAQQIGTEENVKSIDKYIVSMAARGEDEKLNELILEGYDHILDANDGNQNIIEVVTARGNESTLELLRNLKSFEERREKLHRAIRFGSIRQVHEVFAEAGKKENRKRLAMSKNHQGRCSLHVAVLCQHESIVETLSKRYPATLLIGDNLMRTPLHYAMGVEKVEPLSRILIAYGARRVLKDLKGRQPSFYFMNKNDIQQLQDEEEALRV